jgi:beta-lactamase class A
MLTRRNFAIGVGASLALIATPRPPAAGTPFEGLGETFRGIERRTGGRLGVAVLDPKTGDTAGHRADERFPMCSTFKLLAAAALLARVDAGVETLDRAVAVRAEDIVAYSPETEKHVGGTMPLAALCEAAITLSDNTAANLLLSALGGPGGVTAYVRSLGDTVTRLDRVELEVNEAAPGDPRDTTTPAAMAADLEALLIGDALTPSSREKLAAWLIANKVGDARLRAGLPAGWRVGDKTGTCNEATSGDVGILWPPGRPPVLVAAYLTEAKAGRERQNAAYAAIAHAVAAALG